MGGYRLIQPMVSVASAAFLAAPGQAQTAWSDDFEGDLSQWIGKDGGAHSGVIVEDPLRSGNHVLSFTAPVGGGDLFGSEVPVMPGQTHILCFEYLGLPNGGVPGNLGGTIRFGETTPGRHRWLAGTVFCCGIEADPLIDDGQWRTYSIEFDVFASGLPGQVYDFSTVPPANDTIRLMLEDFVGPVAGDVFFDNIQLTLGDECEGPQDSDGDGVPDDVDDCQDSDLGESIIVDACDTGVANELFDDGCTMADRIAECTEGVTTHGEFVSCAAQLANDWKQDGLISGREKGRIQSCAAQGNLRSQCQTDADCDDGLFCNGVEVCLGGACVVGDPCPGQACDEATDECID